jgi:putative transposase
VPRYWPLRFCADQAALRARLRELAAFRGSGYRRLLQLLRREWGLVNHKKLRRRLYREECLQVRRRGGRKRTLETRAPLTLPLGPNQRWSLDFVSDTLTDSRRFRMLAVVDDFTRPTLVADISLSVSGWPGDGCHHRPARQPSDHRQLQRDGVHSMAILHWSQAAGIAWHYITPGKPTQNAFIENFNGRLRDELLNETLFSSLDHARETLADWKTDYRQAAQRHRQRAACHLRQTQRSRGATGRVA